LELVGSLRFHSPGFVSSAVPLPKMWDEPQQSVASLLQSLGPSMACSARWSVGDSQRHDSPSLGKTFVAQKQRPRLSKSSASPGNSWLGVG